MMTHSICSSSNVNDMKISFDDIHCEAGVDSLMQIEAMDNNADSCKIEKFKKKDSKNLSLKSTNMKKHKRKSRRSRNKSGRQLPFNNPKIKAQALRRKQKMLRGVRSAPTLAPYNTTQFIMSDHKTELSHSTYTDSDDDENEFAKKEFSKEYERADSNNKQKTPINKLIEEYLLIETEVKELEKKYDEMAAHELLKARIGAVEYDWEKGEIAMEPEVAEKIKIFHEEIAKIRNENQSLKDENLRFQSENSDTSSSSSDSSSDSSDSDSSSSSSDDDDDDLIEDIEEVSVPTSTEEVLINSVKRDIEHRKDDTGYESSGSTDRVSSTTLRK